MNKTEIILAAFAAGGENATFSPVQAQKLLFLVDREVAHAVGGPHFNFVAYDYGPFDRRVYDAIDLLEISGLASIQSTGKYRIYSLTSEGYRDGLQLLDKLAPEARDYLRQIATWIRRLSFQQLVSAIYSRYPEMKANSVFQQ